MKKGLDISKHQAYFSAKTAAAQGISTVVCRCAYGTGKDICWETFVPAVQAAGLQLGAYGFMTAHYTSKASSFAQAQAVMRQQVAAWIELCKVKGCKVLAVDQELENGNTMLLVSKAYNTKLLQEAVAMIRDAGLIPMIYTGASWCLSYIDWAAIDCDFWVAYYANSSKTSDFAAYADGTFPSGQYGDLLRALLAADKLWGWQYGSTGHGIKYGAGSVNVDRNWIYKEVDKNMTFEPITGKQLVVTSESGPACQAFSTYDVNDKNYKNLALGSYDIVAMGGSITIGGMTAPWVQLADGYYCLALSDRCRIEDKPQTPAVDLTEVLASLARIEATQATQGKQLTELLSGNNLMQDKLTAAGAALAK